MPAAVGNGFPISRSRLVSVQWRICWRSALGTPTISQITSTGNGPLKSCTASKAPAPSRGSSTSAITRSTTGSHSAMRRGVNARLTSLRIRVCLGGSIMIIESTPRVTCSNSVLVSWSSVSP